MPGDITAQIASAIGQAAGNALNYTLTEPVVSVLVGLALLAFTARKATQLPTMNAPSPDSEFLLLAGIVGCLLVVNPFATATVAYLEPVTSFSFSIALSIALYSTLSMGILVVIDEYARQHGPSVA